jgi:hypothetical protein
MLTDSCRSHRRMLRKASFLTRPTPARQDAPFRGQGRSERPKIVLPSSLVYGLQRVGRMSPPLRASIQFCHHMFEGSLVVPRLRASNEHILIVRVPRAEGRPGCPSHPSEAARCASTEDHQPSSSPMLHTSTKGSGRGCPSLRASDEHIPIVRVLRARRAPGRSPPPFFSILLQPIIEQQKRRPIGGMLVLRVIEKLDLRTLERYRCRSDGIVM